VDNSPRFPTVSSTALPRLSWQRPLRASALSEWALLPLRLFLGATFLYAGLQKLANPNFFRPSSPISIQSQLAGAIRFSPIHALLHPLLPYAGLVGMVIAYAELAIGVGTLLGLYARVAAVGGALLSLNLFLTVSFHASPYFTGADIVFFFAWLPFVIAGSGTQLSLQSLITRYVAVRAGAPEPALVTLDFAQVRQLCGSYDAGCCSARSGLACDARACPVLLGTLAPVATAVQLDTVARRSVVVGGIAAATVGTATVLLGSSTAALGKLIGANGTGVTSTGGTTTTSTTVATTGGGTTKGTLLGASSEVPVGGSAVFTVPTTGDPGIILQPTKGSFVAFDSVCPHNGCTVGYSASQKLLVCPCHGSEFLATNGDVLQGPAARGLTRYTVVEAADGNLYLQ